MLEVRLHVLFVPFLIAPELCRLVLGVERSLDGVLVAAGDDEPDPPRELGKVVGDEAEHVWEPLLFDLVKCIDDDHPRVAVRGWRDASQRFGNEGLSKRFVGDRSGCRE